MPLSHIYGPEPHCSRLFSAVCKFPLPSLRIHTVGQIGKMVFYTEPLF